jgi:uncharacterized membrane protein YkgB
MLAIKTKNLNTIIEKRNRVAELKGRIDVIKIELTQIKEELQQQEAEMIDALMSNVPVVSRVYNVALKEHILQNYINWQKEFSTSHPEEYSILQERAGKRTELELVIARKEGV